MSRLSSPPENTERGERLARIRQLNKMTQAEFADRLGLSLRAYRNYELGEREMPVGVLYSLYQELGTDPLWMLVGDKDGKHSPVTRLDVDLLKQLYIRLNDKIIKDRKVRDPNIEADILIHLFVDALERGYNEERLTNFMNMVA